MSKGENRVKLSEYNEKVCVSADIEGSTNNEKIFYRNKLLNLEENSYF